jgi:hypothetical protein
VIEIERVFGRWRELVAERKSARLVQRDEEVRHRNIKRFEAGEGKPESGQRGG